MSGASRRQATRLIFGYIFLHAAMSGGRMAAPLAVLHQGHGTAAAGVAVGSYALTQVLFSVRFGRIADRHGLRRLLSWSIAVAVLGGGLAALWPTLPMLCLSGLATGGAVGAGTIAVQRHLGRVAESPAQMKNLFAWLSVAPAMSNLIGPLGAGLVIDAAGYPAAFAMLGTLPLVTAWASRGVGESPRPQPEAPARGATWGLLRDRMLMRALLLNACAATSWDLHAFMVPVLGHDRGLSASTIGAILASFAFATAGIRLAMPLYAHRVRDAVLVTGATAGTALLLFLYPFTGSALTMGLCSAALGMSLGTVQPLVMTILHHVTPEHRIGEALGLRFSMLSFLGMGMPLVFGALGGVVGANAVFWATGAVVAWGSRLGLHLEAAARPAAKP